MSRVVPAGSSQCAMLALAIAVFTAWTSGASAQSTTNYAAGNMWGTTSGGVGVNGAAESASTHATNGLTAAQVNAANGNVLIDTGGSGGLSIYSIGTQTIVSNTVLGSNNNTNVTATQNATNSGGVTNGGTINLK